MSIDDLDEVMVIEESSQSNPWTKKNFIDCIHEKYWNYVFLADGCLSPILGFCVVMPGLKSYIYSISPLPHLYEENVLLGEH